MENTATKEEKFKRLAELRVNAALDRIRLLGQLSHRGNYDYTDEQVEMIFKALHKALVETKSKFRESAKDKNRFTL